MGENTIYGQDEYSEFIILVGAIQVFKSKRDI
jgi:hypothetical protein